MKKLILFAGLVGLLVACGKEEVAPPKEEPKVEEKEKAPVKEEPKEEAPPVEAPPAEVPKEESPAIEEPKEVTPPPPVTKESINPQIALSILQDAYKGIATVTYNEKLNAFLILPTDPNFVLEMTMILSGELPMDDWNYLVDSLAMLSKQLGPEYAVFLVNPANTNNYLVLAENGVIQYDALNEESGKQEKAL